LQNPLGNTCSRNLEINFSAVRVMVFCLFLSALSR
jgi:hypothetical protein